MHDKPRFTIEMTIRDNYTGERWRHAIGCDEALSISARAVEDLRAGPVLGASLMSFNDAVELIRTKELRRVILRDTALRLSGQIADHLQDAEGWHDASRIEPARAALKR